MNTHGNRGWSQNRCQKCEDSDCSSNSQEAPWQTNNYVKKITFDWLYGTKTVSNSKCSEYLPDSQGSSQTLPETDKSTQQQQPSVLWSSYTQIMVNPMQLQEHEFTAWLDRLEEARETSKTRGKDLTEHTESHTMKQNNLVTGGVNHNFKTRSSQHRSYRSNRLWIISTATTMTW